MKKKVFGGIAMSAIAAVSIFFVKHFQTQYKS
jgi:hypothetical protein